MDIYEYLQINKHLKFKNIVIKIILLLTIGLKKRFLQQNLLQKENLENFLKILKKMI